MRAAIVALAVTATWLSMASRANAQISTATLTQANASLQAGEADKALSLLAPLSSSGAGADQAQNLLCRVRFMLQQWSEAAAACGQAVKLNGQNSDWHMWYGRSLGQQAAHASLFSAYGIAQHSLAEMQAAAQANPKNGPALSDLGDFYAQAPGIAGGSVQKAQSIAAQLDAIDSSRAAQLRGDIAVSQKDYTTAEQQYQKAIAGNPHPAHQWTVLADFYRTRKRWNDIDTAIQNCIAASTKDKSPGIALYDGAGVLIQSKRNPQLAAKMLSDYLAGSFKNEEGPAFIAYIRLSRLKQQLGDSAGAANAMAMAQSLAHTFNPALDKTN